MRVVIFMWNSHKEFKKKNPASHGQRYGVCPYFYADSALRVVEDMMRYRH